jgi:hypothetical protein
VPNDIVAGEELTVSLMLDSGALAGKLRSKYTVKVVSQKK